MKFLHSQIKLTAVTGALALLSVLFSHLALTDIWHATEPDLSAEWWVLRVSAAVIIFFIAVVFRLLITLRRTVFSG